MINICFTCDWGYSSSELLDIYKKQTPNNSGIWGRIKGVTDINSCDVIIHMGNSVDRFYDKHLIQMRREPDVIKGFKPSENKSHYCMDYSDNKRYMSSVWQFISMNFDELVEYELHEKPKLISGITSDKHQHRNLFFENLNKLNIGVDIFGKKYKEIHPELKEQGLKNYKMTISIENSSQMNYFSEKINDCYLYWSLPIYWGCPNISDFFPEKSYRLLDINNPESISQIINEPISDGEIRALKEARDLVIYKYNIWPTIKNILA